MQTEEGFITCSTKSGEHLKICVIRIISVFRYVSFQCFSGEFKNQHLRVFDKLQLESQKFFWIGISLPKMPACLRLQLVPNGDARIVFINVVKIINTFPMI